MRRLLALLLPLVFACTDATAPTTEHTPAEAAAVACSPSPTRVCPGDNAAAKVAAQPGGATITFAPGVHRMQSITTKNGQTIVGEPGAVLDGGKTLTGWRRSGSRWYVGGQRQQNTEHDNRHCEVASEACSLPEQVWVDGKLLVRKTSLSGVNASSWYFDYSRDRIYIGVNPKGRVVETSVTPQAFVGGSNVTIRGLTIEHYATGAGHGTIEAGDGWQVVNVVLRDNNATSVRVSGANVVIRDGAMLRGGEQGIGGPAGPNLLVEGNEIAYNNTANFGAGQGDHKAAGLKVSRTRDMVIRNNIVHHNPIGLWCDISCINSTYSGNIIRDNYRRGIQHEISYGCLVRDNTVERNGHGESGSSAAGIWIAQSSDCEIAGNALRQNANGIIGTDRDRGAGSLGTYRLVNMNVHDNVVEQADGIAAGIQDQHPNRDPYADAAGNVFGPGNHYDVSSSVRWLWKNNQVSWSQWQAAGND